MTNLKADKFNSVLHVTLSRPEVHNALDADLIKGLTEIFKSIKKDSSILAVVLRGAGPSFCAGGDLNWMRKSMKFTLAQNKKDTQKLSDMYEAIFQCPVPVLAVIQGSVMGGGVGLTAVCDIVAAETETKFCLSEVRLGLVPSIISPYVLRKIPESQARPLMLTAEVFKALHAQQIGLVHFTGAVADAENFIQEKLKLIVNNGPEATRITKDLIQKIKTSNWPAARKLTVKTIAQRRVSKEGQEGMNAFFEKRIPTWRRGT
ncbi:MAG: enoyl-CoA hydratase-related protein [Oligoflexia bacterium]|nr:enoyl-CoA hydratase-related protein [Oligoflexia bacterium]